MTIGQATPIFSDIAKPTVYTVGNAQAANYVRIATANDSTKGQVTIQTQAYFLFVALTCWTNYDDVGPVVATANVDPVLTRPFTPNNFALNIQRDTFNQYTNLEIPQCDIVSSGYRSGKIFAIPPVVGPRTNFLFTFRDTTGLFLTTALSAGSPVPLDIYMTLIGYNIPIGNWAKFCAIYPQFDQVFGDHP